ncbi:hypothetical protein CK203_047891 [Vitis vinifera]|uniref:Uncharacterized protein n=1 Tax=Vitis vinifera TaxID=29760 RepID=A0A438GR97_VITVI|nr:hypothetical protein CK203_047891 [Vitis vinifera]
MSTKCTTNLNSFIDKAVKEDYQDAFFWWKMMPTLASSLQFAQTTDGRGIRGQKRCMYKPHLEASLKVYREGVRSLELGFSTIGIAKNGVWGEVDWLDLLVYLHSDVFSFDQWLSSRIEGRSGDGAMVTHLLFADDTLVFCEASQDQMAHLSWLLMWFEAISGLRINLDKSEILLVGRVENLEALALEVGCKVGRLPILTWGSLWGRITSPWLFGMGWKRDFGEGLPCGKGIISPKAVELP